MSSPSVEIAPGVFVSNWEHVSCGYINGTGTTRQFIIVLINGRTIVVQDEDRIEATLSIWRGICKTEGIPPEIDKWMPYVSRSAKHIK